MYPFKEQRMLHFVFAMLKNVMTLLGIVEATDE